MKTSILAFVAVCLFLGARNLGQAQNNDPGAIFHQKITPPSPEAASLAKYGEFPVSLHNGLVDISIPIFEIKTGKLSLPISLSYHAGGVRVNDISSCVGLGWSLNAGGTISRTVMDLPDEVGMLTYSFPDEDDPGEHFECFLSHLAIGTIDGKADVFNYSVGGSSGKFLFRNTGKPLVAHGTITTIPYLPIKIEPNSMLLDTFTITNVDGTTYLFGEAERTTVFSDGSLSWDAHTSWFLTSILSADKADTIRFTYTEPIITSSNQQSNSLTVRDAFGPLAGRVSTSTSQSTSHHFAVNVDEVFFRSGKVKFVYELDREDTNGVRLKEIRLYSRNVGMIYSEVRRFVLGHDYFIATGGQTSHSPPTSHIAGDRRLRLNTVKEIGISDEQPVDSMPPYSFEYEGGQFPLYNSTAQDFMGFYNGAHNNANLMFYGLGNLFGEPVISKQFGADRQVVPTRIKAGTLKRINFPSGGYAEFFMEPNEHRYTETVNDP